MLETYYHIIKLSILGMFSSWLTTGKIYKYRFVIEEHDVFDRRYFDMNKTEKYLDENNVLYRKIQIGDNRPNTYFYIDDDMVTYLRLIR